MMLNSLITRTSAFLMAITVVASTAVTAQAADWGDLSARFVFDGKPASPKPAMITRDQAFCGKFKIVDESLVINTKNNGVRDIIVYLYLSRGQKKPAVHPSYNEAKEVVLDNKGCVFQPRVTLLRAGHTLVVKNSDTVGHNTNFTTFTNPAQNTLIPAGGMLKVDKFTKEERLPAKVACNIHPWMGGWLVVKDHPYMAASDADGKFEIKNLPAGKWTFQFWQERSGYLDDAKINGKSWKRGRAELTIKPGKNDLGEIKLNAKMFK